MRSPSTIGKSQNSSVDFSGNSIFLWVPFSLSSTDGKLGHLRVAHITGDGLEVITPKEITKSHVIIDVTGLSPFGLTFLDYFLGRNIRAMVLLFLQTSPEQKLQVLLLSRNTDIMMVCHNYGNQSSLPVTL